MPFKSTAQMKYMMAKMPKLAKKWMKEYGVPKQLPKRKARKK